MTSLAAATTSPRSAAYRPPVALGAMVSGALHVAAALALVFWRAAPPRPAPPVYRVDLVAAPKGVPRLGELASGAPATAAGSVPPAATPPHAAPPPSPPSRAEPAAAPLPRRSPTPAARVPAPPARTSARSVAPATRARPPAAVPSAPARKPAERAVTPPPASSAGALKARSAGPGAAATAAKAPTAASAGGGTGREPATVRVRGLEFPYPGYLANVVRQVALRFDPSRRDAMLQADVSFLIHRDGSVTDLRVVRASGSYAFDLEAQGAIEAAGGARAFGALPDGFRDDVLPVTFSFDPRVLR